MNENALKGQIKKPKGGRLAADKWSPCPATKTIYDEIGVVEDEIECQREKGHSEGHRGTIEWEEIPE